MDDSKEATSSGLLQKTMEFWQPRYLDCVLTREDARHIIENVTGLFSTLQRSADAALDAMPGARTAEATGDADESISTDGVQPCKKR